MKKFKRGELEYNIQWAKVEFLTTGKKLELKTKADSLCHFFDEFFVDNYKVILRLDWSDIDDYGYPTLDADFYDKDTSRKKKLKGAIKEAHHTSSNENERTYCWSFHSYKELFKVTVQCAFTIDFSSGFDVSTEIQYDN